METCLVEDEFSANAFKPSVDGLWQFHLLNDASTLDVTKIAKLRVDLIGSAIPFEINKFQWPSLK